MTGKTFGNQSVAVTLILGSSRYQLFQLSVNFMESTSTAELFLHGVTDTCSFLETSFL